MRIRNSIFEKLSLPLCFAQEKDISLSLRFAEKKMKKFAFASLSQSKYAKFGALV